MHQLYYTYAIRNEGVFYNFGKMVMASMVSGLKSALLDGLKLISKEVKEATEGDWFDFECINGKRKMAVIARDCKIAVKLNYIQKILDELQKHSDFKVVMIISSTGYTDAVNDYLDNLQNKNIKALVCNCFLGIKSNPDKFIKKFEYCIIPITLNPMDITISALMLS